MHKCSICLKCFSRRSNLERHRVQHTKQKVECFVCKRKFASINFLKRHLKKHEETPLSLPSVSIKKRKCGDSLKNAEKKRRKLNSIYCDLCSINVIKRFHAAHLRTNKHKSLCCEVYSANNIELMRTAFKSRIKSFKIKNVNKKELSIEIFLETIRPSIVLLLEEHTKIHISVKVNIEFFGLYQLVKLDDIETDIKSFNTKNKIVSESTNFNEICDEWFEIIKTKSEEFNETKSGWSLLEILHLEININKHAPLRGSSYSKLPKNIAKKNAVVNVTNSDDNCFAYAIISALFPTDANINVVDDYPDFRKHLNFDGIEMPMQFVDIQKFEEQNKISINVFGLNQSNKQIIGPLHHTSHRLTHHINLLFYEFRKKKHFCWIKDLSKLVGQQLSLHKAKKHICDGCLQYFSTKERLEYHQSDQCHQIKVTLPLKGESNKQTN